jgi:hypothetical protein
VDRYVDSCYYSKQRFACKPIACFFIIQPRHSSSVREDSSFVFHSIQR